MNKYIDLVVAVVVGVGGGLLARWLGAPGPHTFVLALVVGVLTAAFLRMND